MSADIDIDFASRDIALNLLNAVSATRNIEEVNSTIKFTPHNTGIYLQAIPKDPLTNSATIHYKEAETRGYFKLDFLNVGIYKDIRDEEHLITLMNQEPLWELLEQDDFSNLLFHVNGHGSILREMKPRSVEQLAAVLAIIRPAKRHLIGKPWNEVMEQVWIKPEGDAYYFKKSHAHSYAMLVVVHMNLLCEQLAFSGSN